MIRRARRAWRVVVVALIATTTLLALPAGAAAHAFLQSSSPAENSTVTEAPAEVRMTFTEPLERLYTKAALFDVQGRPIATEDAYIGDQPNELILPLPEDLANGTYTVQWRNISAADGHPETGFFAFTVGPAGTAIIPSPPPTIDTASGGTTLGSAGRWLTFAGLTAAIGALAGWLWVVRPAMLEMPVTVHRSIGRRLRRLALGGVAVAGLGSLLLLVGQATAGGGGLGLGAIGDLLIDTRFGHLWLARMVLLGGLAAVLMPGALWCEPVPRRRATTALAVGGLALVPISLNSHAAAQPTGVPAAVAADWLHLAAAAVWIGGLMALIAGFVLTRGVPGTQRQRAYATAIPRFSTLAIIAVVTLSLTGLYASVLHVGTPRALLETAYGRALVIKLLLILPLLVLGALNLRVIGPAMLRRPRARFHFARAIMAETLLGVAILLVVGVLTGLPPGRDALAIGTSGQSQLRFNEGGIRATVQVTPGTVGLNRYTVDATTKGRPLASDTQVLLRIARGDEIEGVREVPLSPSELPGRFEAQGQELSVVGTWDITLILRQADAADWQASGRFDAGQGGVVHQHDSGIPRFDGLWAGVAMLMLGGTVALVVVGARRKRAGLLEMGALFGVTAALSLGLSLRTGPVEAATNPLPRTAESVAIGRELYVANCTACHGVDGHGDGPQAAFLTPPPADLYADHVDDHPDSQIYDWIRDGFPGSAMPGYGDQLSETEIWHLVNYVRSLRHGVEGGS